MLYFPPSKRSYEPCLPRYPLHYYGNCHTLGPMPSAGQRLTLRFHELGVTEL